MLTRQLHTTDYGVSGVSVQLWEVAWCMLMMGGFFATGFLHEGSTLICIGCGRRPTFPWRRLLKQDWKFSLCPRWKVFFTSQNKTAIRFGAGHVRCVQGEQLGQCCVLIGCRFLIWIRALFWHVNRIWWRDHWLRAPIGHPPGTPRPLGHCSTHDNQQQREKHPRSWGETE